MVDAGDLKSSALWACGFKSRRPHQHSNRGNPGEHCSKGMPIFMLDPSARNSQLILHRGEKIKQSALIHWVVGSNSSRKSASRDWSKSLANARRDVLVLGILIAAVVLLIWNGSEFFQKLS